MSFTRLQTHYRLACLWLTLCLSSVAYAEHKSSVSFYVPSFFDSKQATTRVVNPLIDFFGDKLDSAIDLQVTSSYQGLMYKALKGEPDIILAPYFMADKVAKHYLPIWQTSQHTAYIYAKQKLELAEVKQALEKQTILAPSRYAHIAQIAEDYLQNRYQLSASKDYYILDAGGYDAAIDKMKSDKYQFAILTDTTEGFTNKTYFKQLIPIVRLGVAPGTLVLVKRELLQSRLAKLLNQCHAIKQDGLSQRFKTTSGLSLSCTVEQLHAGH